MREHIRRAHHARLSRAILRTVTLHRGAYAVRDDSSTLADDVALYAPALALLCSVSLYESQRAIRANPRIVPFLRSAAHAAALTPNLWTDADAVIVMPPDVTTRSRRMRAVA